MTHQEITKAIKQSKTMRWYNLEDMAPFKNYTPQELENITYIVINPDDQNWQPGFEEEITPEAADYHVGDIEISNHKIPVYVY